MKRKILSLILCCALLLSLAACGKTETPQPTASAGTESVPESASPAAAEGISYADAYAQYTAIYGALLNAVQQRLDAHDARLQAEYPDSYYMNSDYLLLVYVPFTTAYPSLGRELRADSLDAAQTSLRETFSDAVLTMTAPGRYEAVYTYVDKTSGVEVQREGKCQWDCDGLTGAIRVRAYIDGELTEFTEFIPLGGSRYLLYTATDKAIVEYIEGEITALWHTHRISEPAQGLFPGDMRLMSLDEQDFFPGEGASFSGTEWITDDADAQYILTLQNGEMIYTGKISQDLVDADGNRTGIVWQDIAPITLLS